MIGTEFWMISFVGVYNETVDNLDFCCSVVNGTCDAVGDDFVTSIDVEETKCSFGVEANKVDKICDWEAFVVLLSGVLCFVKSNLILTAGSIVAFVWCVDSLFVFVDSFFDEVSKVEESFSLSSMLFSV